jgi:hypothetical protein
MLQLWLFLQGIFTVRLSPLGEVVFVKRNQPRKVPGDVVFRVDDNGYVEVRATPSTTTDVTSPRDS